MMTASHTGRKKCVTLAPVLVLASGIAFAGCTTSRDDLNTSSTSSDTSSSSTTTTTTAVRAPHTTGGNNGGTDKVYEKLDSSAAKTSVLAASGVKVNVTGSLGTSPETTVSVNPSIGAMAHDSGALFLRDEEYSFIDNDGPVSPGVYTDGKYKLTEGKIANASGDTATYDYVSAYFMQPKTLVTPMFVQPLVGGIVTKEGDMPTSGSATYTGGATVNIATDAYASVNNTDGKAENYDADATVTADFAAGTVDVALTNLAKDSSDDVASLADIDEINITKMKIAGNRFAYDSASTFETKADGSVVDVTGANTTSDAMGHFFGYDAAKNAPDEVGGVYLSKGDDAQVGGAFIAD